MNDKERQLFEFDNISDAIYRGQRLSDSPIYCSDSTRSGELIAGLYNAIFIKDISADYLINSLDVSPYDGIDKVYYLAFKYVDHPTTSSISKLIQVCMAEERPNKVLALNLAVDICLNIHAYFVYGFLLTLESSKLHFSKNELDKFRSRLQINRARRAILQHSLDYEDLDNYVG